MKALYYAVTLQTSGITVRTQALIDSGAVRTYIHHDLVKSKKLPMIALSKPLHVLNADGTQNKAGTITHYCPLDLTFENEVYPIRPLVTNLGNDKIILGMSWLQEVNPNFDWQSGVMTTMGETVLPYNQVRRKRIKELIQRIRDENKPQMNLFNSVFLRSTKESDGLIPDYIKDYAHLFDKGAATRFPMSRPSDHAINLKPEFIPKRSAVYPLSPQQSKSLDEFIDENLAKGYIRESKSPMASPFFFVGKKDGTLRPCQDYRYLNEGTIKNAYPIPLISELIDKLHGATVFTKMDLRSGYNNVRIKDGDQWKAAFICKRGLFEPTVMFFGLCNSPATFQAMMNDTLADMIAEGWLVVYMDDILIFSKDKETHHQRTRRVLQRLQEHDLFVKPEKCVFDVQEVEFLGAIITPNHVKMEGTKLNAIIQWPTPTKVKQIQQFLGLGNYYRRFISHYSDIAKPLHQLTRKDQSWTWGKEQQEAFDRLKNAFVSAPVLQIPDPSKPFQIESDASKFASGGVLSQQDSEGKWHPCAFLSKSFNSAEQNYEIYDRELLGIIRCLSEWKHYLIGSGIPLIILSDHLNLTYFRQPEKLSPRQARWLLFLSQFEYKLKHVPGSDLHRADALSRRSDWATEEDEVPTQVVFPDTVFLAAITESLDIHQDLKDRLTGPSSAQTSDVRTKDNLDLERLKTTGRDLKIIDGMLTVNGKIYVPDKTSLRRDIVKRFHDSPIAGHPERWKTTELVKRQFWWPGMAVFIANYVKGCATCQSAKPINKPHVPPLQPITAVSETPFGTISLDFITDLPLSNDFDSILVISDHDVSKAAIFIPCKKTIDADGTAVLYRDNVFRRFGLPRKIISDRGPQFSSRLFQTLCKTLGIESAMSTAYHPQTDGGTERLNQELELYVALVPYLVICSHKSCAH